MGRGTGKKALRTEIKRLREEKGWSQEALADKAGLSREVISRVERGLRCSPYTLKQIAETLGVQIAVITAEDEYEPTTTRIWSVPYQKNPHFVGRKELLTKLRLGVRKDKSPRIQILSGLGGVGKTHIVAQYAHCISDKFAVVWWLHAEPTRLSEEFQALANKLGVNCAPDEIGGELNRRGKWLLILDNVEHWQDIDRFLPTHGDGQILITTRNQMINAPAAKFIIGVWTSDEAKNYLIARTKEETSTETAIALAKELGCFPLALAQAAAYIDNRAITRATYLERFRIHQTSLLAHTPPLDYGSTVQTTWNVSFRRLHSQSRLAGEILNLCAFYAPEGISKNLLQRWMPAEVIDEEDMDDIVEGLRRESLIEASPDSISVHHLVQTVIRNGFESGEQKTWAFAALKLSAETLLKNLHNSRLGPHERRFILPHANAALKHAKAIAPTEVLPVHEFNIVLCNAISADTRGEFKTAITSSEQLLNGSKPNDALSEASNRIYLAIFHDHCGLQVRQQGEDAKADACHQRALDVLRPLTFKPTEKSTYGHLYWWALYQTGINLMHMGDFNGATSLFEDIIQSPTENEGPRRGQKTAALHQIANIQLERGDAKAALSTLEKCLGERDGDEAGKMQDNRRKGQALVRLGEKQLALQAFYAAQETATERDDQRFVREIEKDLIKIGLKPRLN